MSWRSVHTQEWRREEDAKALKVLLGTRVALAGEETLLRTGKSVELFSTFSLFQSVGLDFASLFRAAASAFCNGASTEEEDDDSHCSSFPAMPGDL
jgi:hypothetical protein